MFNITNHHRNANQNHHEGITHVRMALSKRQKIVSGSRTWAKEPLHSVAGNVNLYTHYGK